ncbi:Hypothetical predicted protein, partial [Paramuricea clavata]
MAPKKSEEKVQLERYKSLLERLESLIMSAREKLSAFCSPDVAKVLVDAILPLSNLFGDSFFVWLAAPSSLSEDEITDIKRKHNELAMVCDNTLVSLHIAMKPEPETKPSNDAIQRLPKLDFRPFDKNQPKLWFDQLEIVLASSSITSPDHKFAALLRLMDSSTSSLLGSITRSKTPSAYEDAKNLLIKEFSLSKYDRIKTYLDTKPDADEKLTMFNARVESLFDGLTLDDIAKFCILRHAPAAVHLQLSGINFDDKPL